MTDHWRPYKLGVLASQLSERDVSLIEDIERFRLLDARLIQQLHFPVGDHGHRSVSAATRATNRVLTRLQRLGFIASLTRRIGGPNHGSAATVWQLAATGERFLRARRGEPQRRRFVEPTNAFMAHTLEVASLGVTLRSDAADRGYDVLELDPEPTCWRPYSDATGGGTTLKPDLYVVTADEEDEFHSFVEVDRGTEHMPAIIRKCHAYERYRRSGAEQAETHVFPRIVWVTTTAERCGQIAQAITNDPELPDDQFDVVTNQEAMAKLSPPLKGGSQ